MISRSNREDEMKFQTLVNKVAREMDADSDYNEAVALAKELGATDEVAARVAKELGRKPERMI
jgi:hypothetical protein